MRTLKSFATAALLAASLFGAAIAPASADIQGGDKFRVRGLYGSQVLNLMNGPARWAGVEIQIPFDAHDLRATGVRQGNWVQVSFRGDNGQDYTGWVESQFLAPDDQIEATSYRIINVRRGQTLPLMDPNGNGVIAYIPAGSGPLLASGPCQNGYCPVTYSCHNGTFEGLVDQDYLAAVRPAYSRLPDPTPVNPGYASADTAYTAGYVFQSPPDYTDNVDLLPPPVYLPRPQHHWRPHGHHAQNYGY